MFEILQELPNQSATHRQEVSKCYLGKWHQENADPDLVNAGCHKSSIWKKKKKKNPKTMQYLRSAIKQSTTKWEQDMLVH